MVRPPTQDQIVDAFRAEGLTVVGHPGWRSRCRCCIGSHNPNGRFIIPGRGWGDLVGTLTHITGGGLGSRSVSRYIDDIILGDPSLSMKSQSVTAPDGTVHLTVAGRANHAGKVGSGVKNAMKGGQFSLTAKHDTRWDGAGADGNSFTWGNENIAAEGKITKDQIESSIRQAAAMSRLLGLPAGAHAGHGEVSSARVYVDPGLHMGQFRTAVKARLEPTKPKPALDPYKVSSYAVGTVGDHVTQWEQKCIYELITAGFTPVFTNAGPTMTPKSVLLGEQHYERIVLPRLLK